MKVFISYGGIGDQVTALRLQALGAVNGLTVFVPPAYTRHGGSVVLDQEIRQKLNDAEIILAVIATGLTEACRQELNAGLTLHKSMIVMAYPLFAAQLQLHFSSNLVVIDPFQPDLAEHSIMQRLKAIEAQQSATKAILALGTLALGLLLFSTADRT